MKHGANGGRELSPERLTHLESALDSERRQREQLERRLRDAERRLESALAVTSEASQDTSALLELKAHLAAEMAAEVAREQLEHSLLELEFLAQAESEFVAPYIAPQVQRVIQNVNVPAPERTVAAAPQAPVEWDAKLAAAQMAIDAAEARASHNALQVRKLTEELASARAEQIRIATEMRRLQSRLDFTPVVSSPTVPDVPWGHDEPRLVEKPKANLNVPEVLEADTATESVATEDLSSVLLEALGGAKAPSVDLGAEAPIVEISPSVAGEAATLEDALAAWGEPEINEHAAAEVTDAELHPDASSALESALEAWGLPGEAEEKIQEVTPPPSLSSTSNDTTGTMDGLEAALEGWGEADAAVQEIPASVEEEVESGTTLEALLELSDATPPPLMEMEELGAASHQEASNETIDEAGAWGELVEVDSLNRLESSDAPAEQRLAEALMSNALLSERDFDAEDDLVEDIETVVPVEEVARWEPELTPADEEDDATLLAEWAQLEVDERVDEPMSRPESSESLVGSYTEDEVDTAPVSPESPVEEVDGDAEVESVAGSPIEAKLSEPGILANLEKAEQERSAARSMEAVNEIVAPVDSQLAESDFEPDLPSLMRRGAESREAEEVPVDRNARRKSIVNALQRFIGE